MSTRPVARIVIVVPCFNEAQRLDVRSFQQCAASMPHVRFLFVDDGSTDHTAAVLENLRLAAPGSFAVLRLRTNMGKAEAVRRGILTASGMNPEQVGFWDADLATPLSALPAFCALLDEHQQIDLVIGSRVRLLGRRIERRTFRHYVGRVFATAASMALGIPVYDTQCGAKLFRLSEQVRQVFATPFHSRWIFDVEILARLMSVRHGAGLAALGEAAYELPLTQWRDVEGSKLKLRDFAAAWPSLALIYWKYLRAGARVMPQPALRPSIVRDGSDGSDAPVAGDRSDGSLVPS